MTFDIDRLHTQLRSLWPKPLRMPLLCSLDKSLAAPIISEGWNEMTKGLNTHYFHLEENESYITSIASSDSTLIALGSGCQNGNLYFIKEDVINKENESTSSSRFQQIHHTQLQRPIHSLDWSNNLLLVGTNKGTTYLYNTRGLHNKDNDQTPALEKLAEYQSKHLPESFVAPPHQRAPNSHVKCVSFSPTFESEPNHNDSPNNNDDNGLYSSLFLTTATNHIEIWDMNHPGNSNLRTIEPDKGTINTTHWASLSPYLMATGGDEHILHVIDLRVQENQGIIWQAYQAHSRSIRTIQFNPFLPYWLASGGDDAVVNIWDLRATYHKPLAKIDGHYGPITSVTWGNTRPEHLVSTCMDGTFRLWSLSKYAMPIWSTYHQVADQGTERHMPEWLQKREQQHLVESWKPNRMKSDLTIPAVDLDIDMDDFPTKDQTTPLGAFGIGEWGKMQIGPLYYGGSNEKSKGSVVQTITSTTRPGLFYCATSYGQLCAQLFRQTSQAFLDYPHRFDCKKDPLCYDIDKAIFCRQIKMANDLIGKLKEISSLDNDQKKLYEKRISDFEDRLKVRPCIQSNEWKMDSIPDPNDKRLWTDTDRWQCALDAFGNDLIYWNYRLPPGCASVFKDIPLDTGELLQPQLSSETLQNVAYNSSEADSSRIVDEITPTMSSVESSVSILDRQVSLPTRNEKRYLRRSSTTPNLPLEASSDLTFYMDNVGNKITNVDALYINTNKSGLQRAKTASTQRKFTRQNSSSDPSLATTKLKLVQSRWGKNKPTTAKIDDHMDNDLPTDIKSGFSFSSLTAPSIRRTLTKRRSKKNHQDISHTTSITPSSITPPLKKKNNYPFFSNNTSSSGSLPTAISNQEDISVIASPSPDNISSPSDKSSSAHTASTSGGTNVDREGITMTTTLVSSPQENLQQHDNISNTEELQYHPKRQYHGPSLIAPAKSIQRALSKRIHRKRESRQSSSSTTTIDKDPHHPSPLVDSSPSSSRNAL
ncbi:WD40-repeat-containing domain protein [Halteromyces radiatus]|uniref:WD40-repeat-containing domain protein n=1 Tax=Halteromyces radiatus TaxID=101107 RepID=UPI00221FF427|nr:WD40-repeat-containing domain protein [Halteromyces radiatus]KAI8085011.1 WD40-repeat-containing domain protein [Halteromyces radiatus]